MVSLSNPSQHEKNENKCSVGKKGQTYFSDTILEKGNDQWSNYNKFQTADRESQRLKSEQKEEERSRWDKRSRHGGVISLKLMGS